MADLEEENTSEQATPTLTKAISTILSEVKALKEQVTTLKESVELVEVDPEVEENLVDDEDNDDSESLSTRVARLGSTPAEQTKDGTKSLLQDIASELDLSERTDSPVDEGLANIVLSLLKDKLPEEKSQARISTFLHVLPPGERGGTSYAASKPINLEPTACACSHTGFEITENAECLNSLVGGNY